MFLALLLELQDKDAISDRLIKILEKYNKGDS